MDSLKLSTIGAVAGKSPTATQSAVPRTAAFEDALKTAQSLAAPRGAPSVPAASLSLAEAPPPAAPAPAIRVSLLPSAAAGYATARSALGMDLD